MQNFNIKQVKEINTVIAEVEKSIKAKSEIGAHDKVSLNSLMKLNKEKKEPLFFKCRREYSDAVVNFFVKEKGVTKNRFHKANQAVIFVLK
ncbi:MAG: hypothetical protein SH819_06555 [Cytophagales bacterium]|nr:hypothetical protein [Cytophagales bacterium]